jgi:hypothetical protein
MFYTQQNSPGNDFICGGQSDCYIAAQSTDGYWCMAPPPTCSGTCEFPSYEFDPTTETSKASCVVFPDPTTLAQAKQLMAAVPSATVAELAGAEASAAQIACLNAALGLGPAPTSGGSGSSGSDITSSPYFIPGLIGAAVLAAWLVVR